MREWSTSDEGRMAQLLYCEAPASSPWGIPVVILREWGLPVFP